jgi:hypothetical protein
MQTEYDTLPSGTVVARSAVGNPAEAHDWRLERVSAFGSAEGTGPLLFGRIAGVVVGVDDRIYVLDAQAREVRVFDLNGDHQFSFGGQGSGPGELRFPVGMTIDPGDRVWVSDEGARKYVVYGPDGSHAGDFRRPFRWVPLLRGGPRVLRDTSLVDFAQLGGRRVAVRVRIDSVLQPIDTVVLPAYDPPMFGTRLKSGEQIGVLVPFAPRQVTAIGPSGEIWTGVGAEAYSLALVRRGGDTVRVIEVTVPRSLLTRPERAAAESAAAAAAQQGYDARPEQIPAHHAYYEDAVLDDRGYLWVRRADPSVPMDRSDTSRVLFDIFSEEGEYSGTVSARIEAEPTPSIAKGFLVGTTTDSSGADVVVVYRVFYPRR